MNKLFSLLLIVTLFSHLTYADQAAIDKQINDEITKIHECVNTKCKNDSTCVKTIETGTKCLLEKCYTAENMNDMSKQESCAESNMITCMGTFSTDQKQYFMECSMMMEMKSLNQVAVEKQINDEVSKMHECVNTKCKGVSSCTTGIESGAKCILEKCYTAETMNDMSKQEACAEQNMTTCMGGFSADQKQYFMDCSMMDMEQTFSGKIVVQLFFIFSIFIIF